MASEYRDERIINRPDLDILNERLSIIRTRIEAYVNDAIKSGAIDTQRIKAYITTGAFPSETKTEVLDWFGRKYDKKKQTSFKGCLLFVVKYDSDFFQHYFDKIDAHVSGFTQKFSSIEIIT